MDEKGVFKKIDITKVDINYFSELLKKEELILENKYKQSLNLLRDKFKSLVNKTKED